ncbi:MAG: trigger factor [Candidatus Pollutiaquabacter aromativorans]
MQISQEQQSELLTVLKIRLQPEDYQNRVKDILKRYQKSAQIPGFRPGHVPAGLIKKQYGQPVLLDELNKLVSESISNYVFEQKLEVIGSPMPKNGLDQQTLEDGNTFEFSYEVGLAPKFSVQIADSGKIPYYLVKVDEKMINDDADDLRRRYGKFSNPEKSEENSILYGEFNELDEAGNVKEGGNKTTTTLSIERIPQANDRKPFIGLAKGDTIDFHPMTVIGNDTEVAAMLRLEKQSPAMQSNYRLTVMTISRIELADLNQEFFDKIYGEGNVTSEEEFRAKIREGILAYFERESDRKMRKDLRNELLNQNNLPLPDDFLKRMLKANAEKPMADSEFDHQYYHLAEDLRWNLMVTKLATDQGFDVTEDELKELARGLVRQQFAQYGYYDIDDAKLEEVSERYLNEDGNRERLDRSIRENKVFAHLKGVVKLDMIELPYQEYVARLQEKTQHELEHHH